MTIPLMIISTALALLGAWMLGRGWRGRRVGDHPHCRRCGFDLFGRPADSHACPECGAETTRDGAVVIGHRRRRPALALTGAMMLLVGVGMSGIVGRRIWQGFDWQHHKPVAWLTREAAGTDLRVRDAALRELLRRQAVGGMSAAKVHAVIEAGLKAQGDPTVKWSAPWGEFIETAQASGGISDAQWRTYAEQSVKIDWLYITMRARVRPGEPLMCMLNERGARTAATSHFARLQPIGLVVDGKRFDVPFGPFDSGLFVRKESSGQISFDAEPLRRALDSLQPGMHHGWFVFEARITESVIGWLPSEWQTPVAAEVRAPFEFALLGAERSAPERAVSEVPQ